MEVKLLHIAPLELIVLAIRQCYDSMKNSDSCYESHALQPPLFGFSEYGEQKFVIGEKDKALIKRIIESGHESTLEHCQMTFQLKGFSRAVLQELARHRIGTSLSVKSTRFTLKELKDEMTFTTNPCHEIKPYDMTRASKYLVFTGNDDIDMASTAALERLRKLVASGLPNDYTKYCMPESYKVDAEVTMNLRSGRHFLGLRKPMRALWEIRNMANAMEDVIPEPYKFIFEGCGEDV